MADGKKRSGPPTDCSSIVVPPFQKNKLCPWYLVYEYPGTAVYDYVFCIFLRLGTRNTSRTGSHGQSSGRIFIAAKLFGGLLEHMRAS